MDTFQRLIFLFLFAFPFSLHAQIRGGSGPSVTYGSGGATVSYTNDFADLLGRAVKNDNIGSGVKVTDNVAVNTSRGAINARATSAVSARAIAKGAAIAGRSLPVAGVAIGVGSLIWDLLDENYIRPDGQGGLNLDPGTPLTERTGLCWFPSMPNAQCHLSASSAGAATAAHRAATGWNINGDCTRTYAGTVQTSADTALSTWTESCPPNSTWQTAESGLRDNLYAQEKTQKMCPLPPASTGDFLPSGLCRTGNYTKPLSNDDVIDIVSRDITHQKDKVPLVNDILGTPGGAVDITPGSTTTSGPASQTGTPPAPVVTTGPGGQVTTTESPGIAIRYRGNEIEWEPQQIITTRPSPTPGQPDETTVTDAPDEPSADPGASGGARDFCIDNPKRAGCSELGNVEPPEWNPDEKPVELKAEAPWGSDSASCPPPRIITLGGRQYAWEWTLVCDFFSGVRFAVIASAWIAAVMIFLGARNDA